MLKKIFLFGCVYRLFLVADGLEQLRKFFGKSLEKCRCIWKKKRCVAGDWMNHFYISIHLRLQSIMPTNHMAPPKDANWEKSCECKHLSTLHSENKTLSALGHDCVSIAMAACKSCYGLRVLSHYSCVVYFKETRARLPWISASSYYIID